MTPGPPAVPPGQQDDAGRVAPAPGAVTHRFQDEAVAPQQPVQGEAPVTQAIVDVGIRPGQVEDQTGPNLGQDPRHVLADRGQAPGVVHVGTQGDAGRGHRRSRRQVVVVQGKGVDRGVLGKDVAGAVPVVQVQVHHQDGGAEALPAQGYHGDGHIVEDTEAAAPIGGGVVQAAPQVHGRVGLAQGVAGGPQGAAHEHPLEEQEAVLELGVHLGAQDPRQGAGFLEGVQVGGIMDQLQALERSGTRLSQHAPPQQVAPLQVGHDAERALPVVDVRGQVDGITRMDDEAGPRGIPAPVQPALQASPHA